MEPQAQTAPASPPTPQAPPTVPEVLVTNPPARSPSHFWTVIGFVLAFFFAAVSVYLYLLNGRYDQVIGRFSVPTARLEPRDARVSLFGPLTNGVFKVDDHVLVMVDLNGKAWVIDYTAARFVQASSSVTLDEWVAAQQPIFSSKRSADIPGRTLVQGTLRSKEGVVYADTIEVRKQ
jgi:hypothetical protein